jgi:hypothetical protein
MKATCTICKEKFVIEEPLILLINTGEIEVPDICDACILDKMDEYNDWTNEN